MVAPELQIQKRKRGVVLSSQGWQRLQAAEHLAALRENNGKSYTLEQLSDRTGLSTKTLTKVRRRQKPVDQPTLEAYFEAFGLTLGTDDCIGQDFEVAPPTSAFSQQVPLRGQIPLDSLLYVYRPPAEQICFKEIMQPGALIRIKAPQQFGKTSLMARVLNQAEDHSFRTAVLSMRLADASVFSSLEQFLKWFCASVTRGMQLPNKLDEYWDATFGSSYCCGDYFERYLLPEGDTPLLLAIDDADILFAHPEIATDFFGMLRAWYEQSRHGTAASEIWHRLRLVILHSTEVLLRLNMHQSPFNVGILVELLPFTPEQVQDLALRYGLAGSDVQSDILVDMLGGNPYLTQLALHYINTYGLTMSDIATSALAPDGVFGSYLRQLFIYLEDRHELIVAVKQMVAKPQGVELYPEAAFRLYSLGLVRFKGRLTLFNGTLHQHYFTQIVDLLPDAAP
ncbi:AAA-like domain-containing protein [Leptolyngbya sp. AN02str]|uniref:AAA-like domain-containing protein n=1 Tax=Leptolyngbya sp. AN02str TaxID=3423363 RepID=UPI003D3173F3